MSARLARLTRFASLAALAGALAGCSSAPGGPGSGLSSGFGTLGNIIAFQSTTPPPPLQLPPEEDGFVCPSVIIAEGGAAIRAQSGPGSESLRHQISITEVARECTPTGGGAFRLKVGVEGRVLAGPAGGAGGSQFATFTIRVTRGTDTVASRAARVGAAIPAGQTGTGFSHVEDGIVVPAGRGETEIVVGLGGAGAERVARARRR